MEWEYAQAYRDAAECDLDADWPTDSADGGEREENPVNKGKGRSVN